MLMKTYVELGFQPIPSVFLTDEEYEKALRAFVIECADVVPVDVNRNLIYLSRRAVKPMVGWWIIGGQRRAGETQKASAINNFKRETSLELSESRVVKVGYLEYLWKDRAQHPQDIGCHMAAWTFRVSLTPDELAQVSANLDKKECLDGQGLVAFDRKRLVQEKVYPSILDLYDHIFPE